MREKRRFLNAETIDLRPYPTLFRCLAQEKGSPGAVVLLHVVGVTPFRSFGNGAVSSSWQRRLMYKANGPKSHDEKMLVFEKRGSAVRRRCRQFAQLMHHLRSE